MPTCACQHCGQHIEFPESMRSQEIACPVCARPTRLEVAGAVPTVRLPRMPDRRGAMAREPKGGVVVGLAARLQQAVESVVVGKPEPVRLVLMALLAEGHVLIEDVPGVAKTMLARALARSLSCSFKRLQCTPDLLPTDITGASVFNPRTTEFEFRPGPVFAQVVLADEINRATPRAQAALLEAMAERQVTADGRLYELAPPFFLIATQNPVDHEGTFPLPEAQLDRFLVRLSLGYPSHEQEMMMMERLQARHPIEAVLPVAAPEELMEAQRAVREIRVDDKIRDYIARVVRATRCHDAVALGASPRASLALCRAAQALAGMQGFDFVLPDDIKTVAPNVLAHRLILKPESRLRRVTAEGVLGEILGRTEVPAL